MGRVPAYRGRSKHPTARAVRMHASASPALMMQDVWLPAATRASQRVAPVPGTKKEVGGCGNDLSRPTSAVNFLSPSFVLPPP